MALRRPGAVERPSQAEGPSTEVPLAIWYHAQLARISGSDRASHGPRADFACEAKHGVCTARITQERAFGSRKLFLYLRAHLQIQTRMQLEPYEQKPSGLNLKFRPDGFMFHVKQSAKAKSPVPFLCAPELPPKAEECGSAVLRARCKLHEHRPRGVGSPVPARHSRSP